VVHVRNAGQPSSNPSVWPKKWHEILRAGLVQSCVKHHHHLLSQPCQRVPSGSQKFLKVGERTASTMKAYEGHSLTRRKLSDDSTTEESSDGSDGFETSMMIKELDHAQWSGRPAASKRPRTKARRIVAFSGFLLIVSSLISFRSLWQLEASFIEDISPGIERIYPMTSSFGSVDMTSSHFFGEHDLPPLRNILDPDYGGLEIQSLLLQPEDRFKREVRDDDEYWYHYEYKKFLKSIDVEDADYSPDDTFEDFDFTQKCVPQQWAYDKYQVCNNLHELSYDRPTGTFEQSHEIRSLSNGHYRQTYLFSPVDGSREFVAKNLRYARDWTRHNHYKVNVEALIMEQLTGSEHVSNIYGHCGSTVLVEKGYELTYKMIPRLHNGLSRGHIAQEDLDKLQKDDVHIFNNFTIEEKLDIAIIFAENIAELHGFPKGVIAHDDISADQWMISAEDSRIIFNDFNVSCLWNFRYAFIQIRILNFCLSLFVSAPQNMVPMKYNPAKKQYCDFWAHYPGTFKAPEVYGGGHYVTEQVDIWPFANLVFALLIGLKPWYYLNEESEIQKTMRSKGAPYIDPRFRRRSFIEKRLVEIMERCHKVEPGERPDIFTIVEFLRETKHIFEMTRGRDDSLLKRSPSTRIDVGTGTSS